MKIKRRTISSYVLPTLVIGAGILGILGFQTVLSNIPQGYSQANGSGADLRFSNSSVQVAPNSTFSTSVLLSTNAQEVVGSDVSISFDRQKVSLVSVQPITNSVLSTFTPLTTSLGFDSSRVVSTANTTGNLEFGVLAYNAVTNPNSSLTGVFNGATTLATLTFRANAQATGTTNLNFAFSQAGATNDSNVVAMTATSAVDILNQPTSSLLVSIVSPSPTPSPSPSLPSPSPTPTLKPSTLPSPQPSVVPTPVPSPVPSPSPAPTTGVVIDSFNLEPGGTVTPTTNVRATTTVRSSQSIRVQALTVAVRNSSNGAYDFSGARTNVTIGPNGYTFSPNTRRFPEGNYTAFVAYKLNNRWYNLSPQISFTSQVPAPSLPPAPSVSPTPINPGQVGIDVQSLYLTPNNNITSTTQVRPTVTVRAPSNLRVQNITVAVRDANNNNFDFRGARSNVTIGPNGFSFTPDARTFPAGNYTAFVAYQVNNRWYNVAPSVSFSSVKAVDATTLTNNPVTGAVSRAYNSLRDILNL